jgi:hypothetical protein
MHEAPRKRRFRVSLRMALLVITLVGVALGLWRRAGLLRNLADEHAAEAQRFADSAFAYQKYPQRGIGKAGFDKQLHLRRQHRLHREWSQRYHLAIWRPWLHPEGALTPARPYYRKRPQRSAESQASLVAPRR